MRVSTADQASEGLCFDAEAAPIAGWCEAQGAELVEIVRDEGVSGSKLLPERPGGAKVAHLLDARRPKADAIVVMRMDRLGRDAAEQIALLKRFRSGKVGLVAIAQQIDLATPHGRAMAQIGAVFNELERALMPNAPLRPSQRCGTRGGHGRSWDAVEGRLVPNATEQEILTGARGLRAAGLGYLKVAQTLNGEKRPTKKGGPWQAMSVRSVLHSAEKTTGSSYASTQAPSSAN